MTNITIIQNEERQLQRLAAQRQLYANVKTILGYQFVFSGPLTVLLMFLALCHPAIKMYVAWWGIMFWLSDILILSNCQKELKEKAATIQERFDCNVLSLPWNYLKSNDRAVSRSKCNKLKLICPVSLKVKSAFRKEYFSRAFPV